MAAQQKISNVGCVILGCLSKGPMSGYDIKQLVDTSTRFFFAASYGQIYPELKKLEAAGLITGEGKSQGGRRRTEFTITEAGTDALTAWILEPQSKIEMRDEGIVRLFFSDHLSDEQRIAKIEQLKAERQSSLETLKTICDLNLVGETSSPNLILIYGMGLHQFVIDWCDWAIDRIENPNKPMPTPPGNPPLTPQE